VDVGGSAYEQPPLLCPPPRSSQTQLSTNLHPPKPVAQFYLVRACLCVRGVCAGGRAARAAPPAPFCAAPPAPIRACNPPMSTTRHCVCACSHPEQTNLALDGRPLPMAEPPPDSNPTCGPKSNEQHSCAARPSRTGGECAAPPMRPRPMRRVSGRHVHACLKVDRVLWPSRSGLSLSNLHVCPRPS
jgi:hypothetical protein